MPYTHDVFLSYSHDYPFGEWVKDPFLPLFQGYLTASLGREAQIFSDRDIPTGNSWPERLRNALASSRTLVGIWSPNYFISDWCQCEIDSVKACHKEGITEARDWLLKLAPSVAHIKEYTDGDETSDVTKVWNQSLPVRHRNGNTNLAGSGRRSNSRHRRIQRY